MLLINLTSIITKDAKQAIKCSVLLYTVEVCAHSRVCYLPDVSPVRKIRHDLRLTLFYNTRLNINQ